MSHQYDHRTGPMLNHGGSTSQQRRASSDDPRRRSRSELCGRPQYWVRRSEVEKGLRPNLAARWLHGLARIMTRSPTHRTVYRPACCPQQQVATAPDRQLPSRCSPCSSANLIRCPRLVCKAEARRNRLHIFVVRQLPDVCRPSLRCHVRWAGCPWRSGCARASPSSVSRLGTSAFAPDLGWRARRSFGATDSASRRD